ncbi:MAG: hypothetical protein PQJ58_20435 [Spirochaetales bacterium]|nr:hypothetical protein [Spirochaetales bacterium]
MTLFEDRKSGGKPIARVLPYPDTIRNGNSPGLLADTLIAEEDIVSPLGEEDWSLEL